MKKREIKKEDLLYPELSYKVIGGAFDVYNVLGSGHHEKYYQKALAESFRLNNLKFKEQLSCPVYYNGKPVGRKVLDFLIEDKIVIEIKKGSRFSKSNIDQVLGYLRVNNLRLAILINFGSYGVIFKRIVNLI